MPAEADTYLKVAVPNFQAAGWENEWHSIAAQAGKPDADPFGLLCYLASDAPVLTSPHRPLCYRGFRVANATRIAHDCSISVNEAVRKSAADHGVGEQEALERGMLENRKQVVGMGVEVRGNV
jgi:hypothetical protein